MRVAELGDTILIAQQSGDRPAKVTKVYAAASVEACGFMPLPEVLRVVQIHVDRREAIGATLRNAGFHAYWKP